MRRLGHVSREGEAARSAQPRAHHRVTFAVGSPGRIVAIDDGDPTNMEPFTSPSREAFNGLPLVIVRANRSASGTSPRRRWSRV